jgi:hypothetical protein
MKNCSKNVVYSFEVIIIHEFNKEDSFFMFMSSQGITSCYGSGLYVKIDLKALKLSAVSFFFINVSYLY